MRPKKIFKELMIDNKKEIEMDIKALEKIETKIDDKYSKKLTTSSKN
ncbi:MAG: FbpB family small basic protein [Bacillota bacterium]|nr:FbpB family small basic protein [Bacillota bacterium]